MRLSSLERVVTCIWAVLVMSQTVNNGNSTDPSLVLSSSSFRLKNELNVCSLETSVITVEKIHCCRSQYQWRQFSIKVKETKIQCLVLGLIRASYWEPWCPQRILLEAALSLHIRSKLWNLEGLHWVTFLLFPLSSKKKDYEIKEQAEKCKLCGCKKDKRVIMSVCLHS